MYKQICKCVAILGIFVLTQGVAVAQESGEKFFVKMSKDNRITVYWKHNSGSSSKQNVIGSEKPKPAEVPKTYIVGTIVGKNWTSIQQWVFSRGFVNKAEIQEPILISLRGSGKFCPSPNGVTAHAKIYKKQSSVEELMAGMLELGHMYEVCNDKGQYKSAGRSKVAVRMLGNFLRDKMGKRFSLKFR
ncbi:hypothetical protein [Pontixanthobacter sp. CEM42]|uniref:hypothetical protein n=1 Tax=Pontixanthobacter sp. CEM42 TaxID=2792077 RepID=UPI001ADFB67F|nr:hypothetical protein [Pontixanthobacter sp. CEM42]